eukprot:TRINITY_DN3322_c0_g1_i1.p1 TRINITY_DN3322_c0_g1~~TRINITY_DN3322_c0_g1_i1.p1  ORF type:complete len:357 (+),score=78.46 TRINITY_DN3322_c0_g1_i1:47-1072(+)
MVPVSWRLSVILVTCFARLSTSFCPKGFGAGSFPAEYKIPVWPSDIPLEDSAKLTTISLSGFEKADINEEYLEGPTNDFIVQGRETFWQASGQYFMYYCKRFSKWRIAQISAFSQIMDGQCFAFVSDAQPHRDILNQTYLKGFFEVADGQWVVRENAGVAQIGKLGDQMDAEEYEAEVAGCDDDDDAGDEDTSKCPVMPAVRKVKREVFKAAKSAGNWARRLTARYLGAPEDEDAVPDDFNPLFKTEVTEDVTGSECEPDTLKNCSIKEQFYIQKQGNKTREERERERKRLSKLITVVMKPDKKNWLMAQLQILSRMNGKSEEEADEPEQPAASTEKKAEL